MNTRWPRLNGSRLAALVLTVVWASGSALPGFAAFYAAPKVKAPAAENAPSAPAKPDPAPAPPSPPGAPSEAMKVLEGREFHDPTNPDLNMLQIPSVAMQGVPRDSQGFVDWMKALREGQINPRASLDGKGKMNTLDLDVLLKDTKEMPWVKFPHLSHTLWLDCSNCHPDPFVAKAGANDIAMADIFRGKFCGKCHDRVAFITFFSCVRCHSVPQQGGIALPGTPGN